MHPIMILFDGSECKKIRQFEFLWVLFGYLLIHPINQVVMDLRKLLNFAFYKSNYLWDLTVMCVRERSRKKVRFLIQQKNYMYAVWQHNDGNERFYQRPLLIKIALWKKQLHQLYIRPRVVFALARIVLTRHTPGSELDSSDGMGKYPKPRFCTTPMGSIMCWRESAINLYFGQFWVLAINNWLLIPPLL